MPDEYRGQSYSCDILTASDGSGFIVSLQIDVDTEDAADIISGMEADILKLDNLNISDVQIIAVHDMQIVGTNEFSAAAPDMGRFFSSPLRGWSAARSAFRFHAAVVSQLPGPPPLLSLPRFPSCGERRAKAAF